MTDVSTDHPAGLPYIQLTEQGRNISFHRDCFGEIKIRRKVNEGEWETLIERDRSPFVDEEHFPSGTRLSYSVELDQNNQKRQYELEVRL